MSIYQVKQKGFKFNDQFQITKDGHAVYQCKSERLSWGDKLSFTNMDGVELLYIKQTKVVTMKPTYEIHKNGAMWAELSTEKVCGSKELTLDIPGPNDYKVEGDLWAWKWSIHRTTTGALAGSIDKKWGFTDSYGVKVEEGEDPLALLAICICIDQIFHDDDNKAM
jgi:uncharacterized protein YxjI